MYRCGLEVTGTIFLGNFSSEFSGCLFGKAYLLTVDPRDMKDFPFPSQDQNQDGQVDTEEFLEWASWRKGFGNGAPFGTSGWCYKCFLLGGGGWSCVLDVGRVIFFLESHFSASYWNSLYKTPLGQS